MPIERISSYVDLENVEREYNAYVGFLRDSQKALVDLYNTDKNFKDSNITNLTENTAKLSVAMDGALKSTQKAAQGYEQLAAKIELQVKAAQESVASIGKQGKAYDDLIKTIVRNKIVSDELASSQSALKKSFDAGAITYEQYSKSLGDVKEAQTSIKISNADSVKALNNLEKQAQTTSGSLDHLTATYNLQYQAYRRLSQEEKDSPLGKELASQLDATKTKINEQQKAVGDYSANVGRYSGSFKEAFSVLETQLSELKGTFATLNQNSPKFEQTQQQISLLQRIIGGLNGGFSSTKAEMRAFQEAAVQVGLAVGQTDDKFLQFNAAVGEVKNSIEDIKKATAFQAQDNKFLTGLISTVNGLTGAFGAAQAAVALTGDESEDTQKQMAKFQQLLVLINGLQAVSNTLQEESGAIQIALAAKTGLLSAAKRVQMLVTGQALAVIEADVVATTELAVAQEAATVTATEEAVAVEGVAVASTEAAVATTSLTTALIATGIGAIILAIGAAVVYLASKIPDWIKGNTITIKQQGELADAIKAANDQIVQQASFISNLDTATKTYYENQLALSQAAGNNEEKNFALRKQINQADKDSAQSEIDQLQASNKNQSELAGTIQLINSRKLAAIEIQKQLLAIPEQNQTSDQKDQLKAAIANTDFYSKQEASLQGLYQAGQQARQKLFTANLQADTLELEEAKFNAAEKRKVLLESVKIEADLITTKNNVVLSSDKSTLDQRLSALKSNAAQQRAILRAENANTQNDPGTSTADKLLSAKKEAEEEKKLNIQVAQEQEKLRRQYYIRDRDAQIEIDNAIANDKIKADQKILESDKASNAGRLQAVSDIFSKRRDIINEELAKELDQEGLTGEEKAAIFQKYNSDILALQTEFTKAYDDQVKNARDKELKDWELFYSKRKTQIEQHATDEIVGLNQQRENNKISQRKYEQERKKAEDNANVARATAAVQNDFAIAQSYKQGTKERQDADENLAKSALALSDSIFNQDKDKKDAKKADLEDTLSTITTLTAQGTQAIGALLDIGFNTQKAHLEELEQDQQKIYETEIANIQSSTLSETDKAAKLIQLEKQRETEKEINARKQREIDLQKARFDRDANIANIITSTALAVVKALPSIPLAIGVGVLGAAELAAAIATPLPRYKGGTTDHPGGSAILGDGDEPEWTKEPGKPGFWSPATATIMDLAKHTQVIPLHEVERMRLSSMRVNNYGILVTDNDSRTAKEMRGVKDTIIWQTGRIERAVKTQDRRTTIINKIETKYGEDVYKKVYK